jgi:dihydropteroate synthase
MANPNPGADKGTNFSQTGAIECGQQILNLNQPVVMGILNITQDSFFDGGRYLTNESIIDRAGQMLEEGAAIIDIGAVSTRPGSAGVSAEAEIQRLIPAIEILRKNYPEAIISADTFRSAIAAKAIEAGAGIINDISGGTIDEAMIGFMAETNAAYVLMHIQGTPENMQVNPVYSDVTKEVSGFFRERLDFFESKGKQNIILDPGFGFGKNTEHNYRLLGDIKRFTSMGYAVLAGVSRKSMINRVLETTAAEALNGTSIINTIALLNGARILRVHDVKEAVEAIKLTETYLQFSS